MTDGSRKLHLYADNTFDIVRNVAEPVYRNLERKMQRGVYDSAKALVACGHIAEAAAKSYCREYGSRDDKWFQMFPPSDRRECAAALLSSFESEVACGNGWLGRKES